MSNYTREPAKEVQLPPRLPLLGVPNQRGATNLIDSRLVNGYIEQTSEGQLRIVKRPGLRVERTLSGNGAGLFGRYSIFYTPVEGGASAKLYENSALIATVESFAGASDSVRPFSYADVAYGIGKTTTFFQNGFVAFTYDSTQGYKSVPLNEAAAGPLTASITNGSPIVICGTSGLTEYSLVTGTGIPADTLIESIDSSGQLTLTANATATNAAASLTFALGGPGVNRPATNPGINFGRSSTFVLGVADYNTSTYLFDTSNGIQGSDVITPYAWNPLNYLFAQAGQSQSVALGKQLSYLVAFKTTDTEFFRDAGLSPGSPLERVDGLRLPVGAINSTCVSSVDSSIFWASYAESGLRSVWHMFNAKAREIATPAVSRIITASPPAYAISFVVSGHTFYCLTSPTGGYTLVYDLKSDFWSYWKALGAAYFPFVAATAGPNGVHLQHATNGKIYNLDPETFTDESASFDMDIYPPDFDGGTRLSKYLSKMYIVGDQVAGSKLLLRTNDSNQRTGQWTNFREFDLSSDRPRIDECGSFYKRSFHFRHPSATSCRLEVVELDLQMGTL